MKNTFKISLQQSQDNIKYQALSVQIQTALFTFKITKEIVKQTGKTVEEIKQMILKLQGYKWHFEINQHQRQLNKIILMKCLHKIKQRASFSCELQFPFPISIMKQISHVTFQNTKYLGLVCCNINNIQDLQFLNAPKIEYLQLIGNRIVQINGIIKNINMKNLGTLSLYKGSIKQISKIQRANFQKLYYILLDIQSDYEQSIVQNLFFIAKIQGKIKSKRQTRLWAVCQKRIKYINSQTLKRLNCKLK